MVPNNGNKKVKREELKKQKRRLEARLLRLEAGLAVGESQSELERKLQLVKAELKDLKNTAAPKSSVKGPALKSKPRSQPGKAGKKPPLPGGASFPSFQLPSPKSPNFAGDSLKTIENIRSWCKKCMGYMQRADQLIDGLHGMGNQLHEAGVLPKIMGGKIKDLTGNDWMTLLTALMSSPLSGAILGGGQDGGDGSSGGGGGDSGNQATADTKELEPTEAKAEPEGDQADNKADEKPAKKEKKKK